MINNYIWIGNKRYYFYDTYNSWLEAYKMGKYQNKKNKKCKYWILIAEQGYLFPYKKYRLYLTKVARLGII